MDARPLVSVIIPTWNRRELVKEAIASVLAQTYSHFELIVVDDGSTDGTADELRKLKNPRLRVIAAEHSGSTAISRNRGIGTAKGDWIAFLDSDDLWVPTKLELQLAALRQTPAGWCYGNYTLMGQDGAEIPLRAGCFRPLSGSIIEPLLLGQTAVHVDCLLISRDLLQAIGPFDPSLQKREDLDFDFRLALAADAVALDQTLARVRDHPTRKTAGGEFAHEHTAKVYRNFIARGAEPRLRRIARRKLAEHLAESGSARMAQGDFAIAVRMFAESMLLGDAPGHWWRAGGRGLRRFAAYLPQIRESGRTRIG